MTQTHLSALDIPTISIVSVSITALLGLFLIITWLQERDTRALAWWGVAYLIGASSIALWGTPAPLLPIPSSLTGVLIFVACGMIWNGIRLFHGRKLLQSANIGGAFVWLAALQFPEIAGDPGASATWGALIVATYTFFIAFELWRERRKSLFSRTAAIAVPLMHAAIFILPIALKDYVLFGIDDGWIVVFAFETMIYAVGIAFIVVLMVKDHHVRVQRDAASIDPLTGLLNRRAFFENTKTLYGQAMKSRQPVALLMFDLDKFKSINDTYGHGMGDEVLRLFAATTRASMRANDVIARLGGEEIAAVVMANEDLALRIAERVRLSFEKAGATVNGEKVNGTVSVGIASDASLAGGIETMMARADAALYRAKRNGRNRICVAESAVPALAADETAAAPGQEQAQPYAEAAPSY